MMPPAVDAQVSPPTQLHEFSNEECQDKAAHRQELATQAEDLSVKLLYLDLADLWQAIRQDMAEGGPITGTSSLPAGRVPSPSRNS
jgi:hypothetical protein